MENKSSSVETSQQGVYVPCVGDSVLGIVVDCQEDNFLVDIKGPVTAILPVLAFEGATKTNIPKIEVGTLLYLRVVTANNDMNPELSCTDANGKTAMFGPLRQGQMFESSTDLSKKLLKSPQCQVLESLGKKLSYELAVGLNGRFWVNAASMKTIVLVSQAIIKTELFTPFQQKVMVEKMLEKVK